MDEYRTRVCRICADILNMYADMDAHLAYVVRCKDCKWRVYAGEWVCGHALNSDGGAFTAVRADDDFYCGRGERKVR